MLYSNLESCRAADYTSLTKVLKLLSERDFNAVEDGRIQVDSETYIQVLSYQTQDVEAVAFERHHNRLDIHYLAEGKEAIYLSSQTNLKPVSNYNVERDIEFVEKPENINRIILEKGDFLVIGMDEPHKTNGWVDGQPAAVKKVVVKTTRK